jgi:hypothetical protein
MMRRIVVIFAISMVYSFVSAKTGAGGLVYGEDHSYFVEAPKGWVVDSGDATKMHFRPAWIKSMRFYPPNTHWPESGVIIYAEFFKKHPGLQTTDEAIGQVVLLFQKDGYAIHPKKKPSIKTEFNELVGEIYHFGPNRLGQYYACAYCPYKGYIDYIVLIARGKDLFERSLAAFEQVVRSYAPQLRRQAVQPHQGTTRRPSWPTSSQAKM